VTHTNYTLDKCALQPETATIDPSEVDVTVETPRNDNQVFIIRIRIVPREMPGKVPIWRGEIEQLNTGKKVFLKNLNEIISFIQPILEDMGADATGPPVVLPKWLNDVKDFLNDIFQRHKS